ncbi:MAG: VWA domain-containing protein [Myxococcota bacterium]|nr:VWA domain-containing protein [Myxococcota bacterium]
MPDLELRDPIFLLAGVLAPLVIWLAARAPARVGYSSTALVSGAPRSWRARLATLPAFLLGLAALALAVAMAGPRTGDATSVVRREGIAIVVVVDRSGSMQARDFVAGDASVDRLEAVKRVFRGFVTGEGGGEGRPDDLIGIVAFARYADAACPLTLDHANLLAILEQIEIVTERSEDGTAVGEGLALAVERLRRHPAESKVAILLTDGVSNVGEIEPVQAADLAAEHGIKVYAIGAGRTGYAPIPVERGGRTVLRRAFVELDEATLRRVAERTGGRYFHASDAEALAEVVAEIDRLERTEITEVRYLQYTEHYASFVLGAVILIVVSGLSAGTLLRRLP